MENYNDVKYYLKILTILVIVFVVVKFIIKLATWEAILLSLIIVTSILIIENIVNINQSLEDPLNCNKCKVSTVSAKSQESFSNFDYDSNLSNISFRDSENKLHEFKCMRIIT